MFRWANILAALTLWLGAAQAEHDLVADNAGGASCPCVPDEITFQFDFTWGCAHPPSASDFASSSYCSITGSPRNSSIKKVVIQDRAAQQELVLDVHVVNLQHTTTLQGEDATTATYSFTYKRSSLRNSPTVLWLDFYNTYSTTAQAPVASIDLNYSPNSIDCVDPHNPLYWKGDWVYFLTVLKVVETRDPRCSWC